MLGQPSFGNAQTHDLIVASVEVQVQAGVEVAVLLAIGNGNARARSGCVACAVAQFTLKPVEFWSVFTNCAPTLPR
jgi:hypothetical protein